MSLRDQIMNADDLQSEEFPVPEWGVTVWIRSLPSGEFEGYLASMMDKDNKADRKKLAQSKAGLLVRCLYDANGDKIFNNGDIDVLAAKNAKVVARIYTKAAELNGASPEAVEDAEKN